MKYIFIIFILLSAHLFSSTNEHLLSEIKILIEQNGKKIEQNGKKIEQNGKKIEQNGKKIEQNAILIHQNSAKIDFENDKLNFMQNIIYIILAGVFGVPFYLNNKNSNIIVALRELAQDDPKVKRALNVAGIS